MTSVLQRLALLGTLTAVQPSQTSFPTQPPPTLVLRVANIAHIPRDVLADARREVQAIYQQAGVQIVWRQDNDIASGSRQQLEFTVIITPDCIGGARCQSEFVTGFAMGSKGRGLRRAYIFSNRVYELAFKFHKRMPGLNPEALVMGCAIAHETGHLLLPPGHSDTGLMRPVIDMRSITDAMRGALVFTTKQAELIREVLPLSSGKAP